MRLNKFVKRSIYIASSFFVFFLLLSVLRNLAQNTESDKDAVKITHDDDKKSNGPLKQWKYITGDNSQYSSPVCNDGAWKIINPKLNPDSVSPEIFNSIIWLRCWFKVPDSLVRKTIALNINHYGASEIYIDGRLQKKFGKVSVSKKEEFNYIPDFPVVFLLPDTNVHLLAIRYSNHNALKYLEKYEENLGGIEIKLMSNAYKAIQDSSLNGVVLFMVLGLFGFSLTLSIVHFLLYLFYRKQKENLYFAMFMFFFAFVMIKPFLMNVITVPSIYLWYEYYSLVPPMLALVSLTTCMYILFKPKYVKVFFLIGCVFGLLTYFTDHVPVLNDFSFNAWFMLVIYTCIECARSIITGFKRKQEGVKIIGTGVIIFLVVVMIYFIMIAIFSSGQINVAINGLEGLLVLVVSLLAIVSVPLSMSIYLARNFAITNKNLHNKLIEVEELSEKSIRQEKEKQQILAMQNEMLEHKVTERTAEVVEQKRIVEEKQKEIIDSITYAKRLQQAILPPQKFIDEHFSNNFVLYKPKDIVAGDFYWSEMVGDLFFLAAADSTGHGVPGAMVSVVCSNALNRAVKEFNLTETGKILDKTRELVIETFEKSNAEVKDGMDISILCIDKQNKKVFWTGANNPLWYIQNGELIEIKADKQPVGKSYHSMPFTTNEIAYKEATTFYLFTDGLADQFGGPQGKKFKYKQFETLLVSINDLPMIEQSKIINDKFDAWKGELDQVDDVCVIGVKI